ncbi:hypothetical protein [Sinomicrobium weinanense]|uniref:Uncharacterized protein n=1 Tax=Sinomicrobium weinanense TaxID=2842200 RepID=A0A926Q2M9_9FLAO|nr:hypothetical protein [Sinomicrobium weinanense]MBC9795101.1 hypothetical protein [Sinomicrobium weinanense]MBU3123768.1 hypothetical protein [Sinomicrobium weinanense]
MRKIISLAIAVSALVNCKNPNNRTGTPSEPDILNNIEAIGKQEEYLKTELQIITDLEVGMEKAKTENKPILLCFTGYAVINSRKMESEVVMKNKTVFETKKNDYINIWLYVDDKDTGKKWKDYQKENFDSGVQPYFVIPDTGGHTISEGLGYREAKVNPERELFRNKL